MTCRVLFELVLMDIIMPEMGGYESTQNIRRLEREFNLSSGEKHFICGFSAMLTPKTQKKCIECGMNTIMEKPLHPSTLKQLLEENQRSTNQVAIENMSSKNVLFVDPLPNFG